MKIETNLHKNDVILTKEFQFEITKIHKEYNDQIKRQVGYMIHNEFDANDIIQDVYIKISKFLHTFNENLSALSTWIHNITDSVIKDWFRTNHQNYYCKVSSFVDKDGNPTFQFKSNNRTDGLIDDKELREKIMKVFKNLKPTYRKIAIMYFINELGYLEISDKLNIPLGTVKGKISRCREILKKELNNIYKVRM